ncbi:hypothetical protein K474DRAFT_1676315 [Panus rudis PR-1116 ss-1]|nr:hypothetical protein K474DRAFT_1676315 [Panus rudis PR-1116 ss-1]
MSTSSRNVLLFLLSLRAASSTVLAYPTAPMNELHARDIGSSWVVNPAGRSNSHNGIFDQGFQEYSKRELFELLARAAEDVDDESGASFWTTLADGAENFLGGLVGGLFGGGSSAPATPPPPPPPPAPAPPAPAPPSPPPAKPKKNKREILELFARAAQTQAAQADESSDDDESGASVWTDLLEGGEKVVGGLLGAILRRDLPDDEHKIIGQALRHLIVRAAAAQGDENDKSGASSWSGLAKGAENFGIGGDFFGGGSGGSHFLVQRRGYSLSDLD